MLPGPPLLVPQPSLRDSPGHRAEVGESLPALLCTEVECLLPYTALCSAFKENLSSSSGKGLRKKKDPPWKLDLTFARFFCKTSLLPFFFPVLFLVLVRVCDSSQRLKHSISFPAALLPVPASSPKAAMRGDTAEHKPGNGVHCSQQREPKSTDCPIYGLYLDEQKLRMGVHRARGCPSSG